MKRLFVMVLFSGLAFGQAPKVTPSLDTADRIAIQACEKAKQQAQGQFTEAQQQEITVLREWDAAHPGFTINQKTFAVEAVPAKKAVK